MKCSINRTASNIEFHPNLNNIDSQKNIMAFFLEFLLKSRPKDFKSFMILKRVFISPS